MAARTWTQTSGNLWSTAANWNGGVTVPQAGDTVTFDATSTAACTVDNIGAFNGTITVAAAYTNTITQSAAVSGVSTIAISGGIWNAAGFGLATTGNANITVAATKQLQLGAASVTSTGTGSITCSGTLTFSGAWTHTGALSWPDGSVITGTSTPTLNVNGTLTLGTTTTITNAIGTITASGTTAASFTDTTDKLSGTTWVINKTNANFVVAASTTCRIGATPTTSTGTATLTVTGTLTYSGTWTHTGNITTSASSTVTGSSTPALTIDGSLNISATATGWTSVAVTASGTNSVTYTDTAAKNSGTWTVNKTGGTFAVAASTSMALGANPTTNISNANTMTINGTVTATGAWAFSSGGAGASLTVGATGTISGPTSLTLQRVFTVTAGGTIPASLAVTFNGGAAGVLDASGITLGTCIVNKTASTMAVSAGSTLPLGATPTTAATTFTVTGAVSWSGTWTHTGALTVSGTPTFTGTSTPIINITEGAATFTAATLTSPIGIIMTQTSASSRTFTGAALTYTTFTRLGSGTGTLIIASSNTFTTFTDNAGLAAHTLQFTSTTTQTATQFFLQGSTGKTLTINASTGASAAILHKTGTNNFAGKFLSVQDSTVDASPVWYAGAGSTNVSGNTNWIFTDEPNQPGNGIQPAANEHTWRGVGVGRKFTMTNG